MNRRELLRGTLGVAALGFFGWRAALTEVRRNWRQGLAVVVFDREGRCSLGPELIEDNRVSFELVGPSVEGRYVVVLCDGTPVTKCDLDDYGQSFRGNGGSVNIIWDAPPWPPYLVPAT